MSAPFSAGEWPLSRQTVSYSRTNWINSAEERHGGLAEEPFHRHNWIVQAGVLCNIFAPIK